MLDQNDRPALIGKIQTPFGLVTALVDRYADGSLAIRFESPDGDPFGALSINVPDQAHVLQPGEFFAKTYSENASISEAAIESGFFADTGRVVRCGYLPLPIWRIGNRTDAGVSVAERSREG